VQGIILQRSRQRGDKSFYKSLLIPFIGYVTPGYTVVFFRVLANPSVSYRRWDCWDIRKLSYNPMVRTLTIPFKQTNPVNFSIIYNSQLTSVLKNPDLKGEGNIMTRMNEVVEQIEMVIDDKEYPATLNELITLRKILERITHQCSKETVLSQEFREATIVTPYHHSFPVGVYNLLRIYERQRHIPTFVRTDAAIPCNTFNNGTRSALSTG
jgi:hypothetical protein